MRRNKLILCLIVIMICLLPMNVYSLYMNSELILYGLIKDKHRVVVENIHSVNLSKLRETYRVDKTGIYNIESLFPDQGGAGVSDVLEPGETQELINDGFVVTKNHYYHKKLNFIINVNSGWQLMFDKQELDYKQIKETSEVSLTIKKDILLTYLYKKIKVLMNEI